MSAGQVRQARLPPSGHPRPCSTEADLGVGCAPTCCTHTMWSAPKYTLISSGLSLISASTHSGRPPPASPGFWISGASTSSGCSRARGPAAALLAGEGQQRVWRAGCWRGNHAPNSQEAPRAAAPNGRCLILQDAYQTPRTNQPSQGCTFKARAVSGCKASAQQRRALPGFEAARRGAHPHNTEHLACRGHRCLDLLDVARLPRCHKHGGILRREGRQWHFGFVRAGFTGSSTTPQAGHRPLACWPVRTDAHLYSR